MRHQQQTRSLAIWTLCWLMATALVAFGPKLIWHFNVIATLAAVGVQLGTGILMVLSLRTQVRGLDELQQRIQLEAASSTLAAGLVIAGTYELLQDVQLISFTPEISHMMIIMALTYMVALGLGHRRYA